MSSSRHRSRRNCMSTRNNMCNRRIKPTGTLVTVSLMCVTNTNTSVLDAVITDKPLEDFSLTACAHMSVTSDNAWEHEISKGLESIDSKRQQQRRRYAQQGTTAKNHARLFVQHDYHDRAQEARNEDSTTNCWEGGIMSKALFPAKLHCVLNDAVGNGWEHIISWAPHGRCFAIHNHKEFVVHVMPKYFCQSKLTSFQRQLNLYGFNQLTRGPDRGSYYHEYFLRGRPRLADHNIVRTKIKGTGIKAAGSPHCEPNFYALAPVGIGHTKGGSDIVSLQSVPISNDSDSDASLGESTWASDVELNDIAPICSLEPATHNSSNNALQGVQIESMALQSNEPVPSFSCIEAMISVAAAETEDEGDIHPMDFGLDNDEQLAFLVTQLLEAL